MRQPSDVGGHALSRSTRAFQIIEWILRLNRSAMKTAAFLPNATCYLPRYQLRDAMHSLAYAATRKFCADPFAKEPQI